MLEELRRAVIKRIDQVVKVDAAMVLLKDGLGGAIQDLPLMGNVFAKGTEFRQTLLDICSAELLEYFASLSPDFFRSNCFDEALDDLGGQGILANHEEMEDGGSEAGAKGDDANRLRGAS